MKQALLRNLSGMILTILTGALVGSCHYEFGNNDEASRKEKNREAKDPLYNAFCLSAQEAWVIGYYGNVFHTADGGRSWTKQETGVDVALYGIHFTDRKRGWVCGSYGTLLATQDGGETWSQQESGSEKPLFDIGFVDVTNGIVVGHFGTVLRTYDGGVHWQDISMKEDMSLNALDFVDGSTGWVVGEFGTILRTDDFGNAWTKQVNPVEEASLFGVDFANKSVGYATGIDGIILKTTDGGKTWIQQASEVTDTLWSVYAIGDHAWAVGLRGTALRINASQANWKSVKDLEEVWGWLRAVHFAGPKAGWIVGEEGMIFRTEDGRQWTKIIR
jgi:photosystem II stability/assembly factor-like uncharacterized protein